jgi:hypothetical protein
VTHLVAVGGSDAGVSAALRARELDGAPDSEIGRATLDARTSYVRRALRNG